MGLDTLLFTAIVAALAPVLVALAPGPRVPQVVVLLANVGLGFLFLLAGYELDLQVGAGVPMAAVLIERRRRAGAQAAAASSGTE